MRDPYEVLGVARSADQDAIKQAYRKLAKQLHPDLNPGNTAVETRFKEVSAAYDLLSDPKKKERYDRGEIDATGAERAGSRAYRGGGGTRSGGFGGFDADDIFEMFNQGRARQQPKTKRGADVNYSLSVDFIAAATGTRRRLTLPDGRTLDVVIPPGTAEGTVLRLKGQGQPAPGGATGGQPGDAFIEVQIEPHPYLERRGNDIHLDLPVTLPEAALGASIPVPTIDGKVSLKIPPASNTGSTLRLKGRGIAAKDGTRGDQYVRIVVTMPEKIDGELKEFLEKWGPRNPYDVRKKFG